MITVINGTLIRDTRLLGKMDPIVVFEYKGIFHQTQVNFRGGKLPVWNHSLDLMIDSPDDQITITCYDKNKTDPVNLVGSLTLFIG